MKKSNKHLAILVPFTDDTDAPWGPIRSIAGIAAFLERYVSLTLLVKNNALLEGHFKDLRYDAIHHEPRINFRTLTRFFKGKDIVWIHSIYSFRFSILPVLSLLFATKKTIVISTRGQLLPGAMTFKKKLFLFIYFLLLKRSRHRVVLHYSHSNEIEKSNPVSFDFEKVTFGNMLPELLKGQMKSNERGEVIKLGFFGRIAPIKNIEFLIELLPLLDETISLHVHGTVVDVTYFNRLKQLVDNKRLQHRVIFHGTYTDDALPALMKDIDIVVLPSHSENFCHVFFESIRYGTLVLGSTGLPWEEINEFQPDTIVPLEVDLWRQNIEKVVGFTSSEYERAVKNLQHFYKDLAIEMRMDMEESIEKIILAP